MNAPTLRILLPEKLRALRNRPGNPPADHAEVNLYFANIIDPYRPEWDVQVHCAYGKNYGNRWSICDDFPRDVNAFPLTLAVFDEYGRPLAEKTITVELCDKRPHETPYHVLFFGDSMTHLGHYVTHTVTHLHRVKTVGTRSFNDLIYHEGRGGWAMRSYFQNTGVTRSSPSPFLFPVTVAGRDYYGDIGFYEQIKNPDHNPYGFDGYRYEVCRDGQYFLRDGKLFQKQGKTEQLVDEAPAFALDFAKYIERHDIKQLDAVSILMGANDLQRRPYAESEEACQTYLENLKTFIAAIRAYDERIAILINMPVLGSEQYHWGVRVNCTATAKQYRHNILRAAELLLETFDGREAEGLYLCPMVAVLDPEHGFDRLAAHPNLYSEVLVKHQANWVHPNRTGYCQMGDALAALIESIR